MLTSNAYVFNVNVNGFEERQGRRSKIEEIIRGETHTERI
jgi:hypothetical protein